MSVTTRLKKIEKQVAGSGECALAEAGLMVWLSENPYIDSQGEAFYEWCERMPKRFIKSFAEYVRRHIPMGTLNVGKDWVDA
jgi:hypothetical protein